MRYLAFLKDPSLKIKRVAGAPNDLWNEFAARSVGFNKMLELTRSEKPNEATRLLAESMGADVVEIQAEVQRLEVEDEEAEKPDGKSGKELAKEKREKLVRAVAAVFRLFKQINGTKKGEFKSGDGYTLQINYVKPASVTKISEDK